MVHSVEQLVFVDEASNEKVDQTEEKNQPRALQHAVHGADDKDEQCLWQIEAVTEDWWLDKLRIVWFKISTTLDQSSGTKAYPVAFLLRSG